MGTRITNLLGAAMTGPSALGAGSAPGAGAQLGPAQPSASNQFVIDSGEPRLPLASTGTPARPPHLSPWPVNQNWHWHQ
jgi:hypothetical protein